MHRATFLYGLVLAPTLERADSRDNVASLYDRLCLPCHGATGGGDGPAAPLLRVFPRDFTHDAFKWRSTPSGAPPQDKDVAATIARGAGEAMPAFGAALAPSQIAALARFVRGLSARQEVAPAVHIADPPPLDAARTRRGADLWRALGCTVCHGETGRGNGSRAAELRDDRGRTARPYDLTREPARGGATPRELYRSLATGLDGTPMPSYVALSADDLWALVAFVTSIAPPTRPPPALPGEATAQVLPESAAPLETNVVEVEQKYWHRPLATQGVVPPGLAPAEASLRPDQCGRCHARQLSEWRDSLHARAFIPGTKAQLLHADARTTSFCQDCHAPLFEQRGGNAAFDDVLRDEGVACAACHLRAWKRHGAPAPSSSGRLATVNYPLQRLPLLERSDFCMSCHQHEVDDALNGKPLLDTYREWLASPYFARGVQCQNCHMPDREHTWRGAHDARTVRQALRIDVDPRVTRGRVDARIVLRNVGCGHQFPSTPTPAAVVTAWLVDDDGEALKATHLQYVIAREIEHTNGVWIEHFDHRIPPGESIEVTHGWSAPDDARALRVVVTFYPDRFYAGFFDQFLRGRLPDDARDLAQQAERRARASMFTIYDRTFQLRGETEERL